MNGAKSGSQIKTVWMVSGNKGGVGKSLFCLALASALEMREVHFSVLDGDSRTGDIHAAFLRKCPALAADFRKLRPESHMDTFDADYEQKIHQLLRACPHLIINTPDGADDVLALWFQKTLKCAEENNYLFKFIYLMSDRADGLKMLPDLSKHFSYTYPVRNLHFGPTELFSVYNQQYSQLFRETYDFPVLRGAELRMLFNHHTYPAEALRLVDPDTQSFVVPALARARLQEWQLKLMDEWLDNLIDNLDQPNIRAL